MPCNPNQIEINGLCCDSNNAQCIQNAIKSKPNTLDNILKIMTTLGTIAPSLIPLFMNNGTLPPGPKPPVVLPTYNDEDDDKGKGADKNIWIYVGIGVVVLVVVILLIFKKQKQ